MRRFEGRVAIVSGAAQGIGRAIAERLGQEGATVAVADLNGQGAQATAKAIGGKNELEKGLIDAIDAYFRSEDAPMDKADPAAMTCHGVRAHGARATAFRDAFAKLHEQFPDHPEVSWRYVFLSGLIPAAAALLVRFFVKEPERWMANQDRTPPRVAELFAPAGGVPEDPATGSAAGPLACHIVRHGLAEPAAELEITQGVEIKRPSTLYARVEGSAERIEQVEVGGSAIVVARGEFRLD